MSKKPTVLMILDGYGLNENKEANAVAAAKTPVMDKLMKEQNVNKATKVMMDLQKPLKKFYEKKSSKYTKEMVEEFINTAKKDEENFDLDFVKLYLK